MGGQLQGDDQRTTSEYMRNELITQVYVLRWSLNQHVKIGQIIRVGLSSISFIFRLGWQKY